MLSQGFLNGLKKGYKAFSNAKHWSEWPSREMRRIARVHADHVEQYCRVDDVLLCFVADFKTPQGLTRHEREVLVMIAFGRGTSQIAATLRIKTKTVYAYRSRIIRKLDCANLTQATARELVDMPAVTWRKTTRVERRS